MFAWLSVLIGKVPQKMWVGFAVLVVIVGFVITFASFIRADAKKDAEIAIAKAKQDAAEKFAKDTAELSRRASEADAQVGRTETIVIRETADAARAIEAAPGSGNVVDLDAWRAARGAVERMRQPADSPRPDSAAVHPDPATP